MFKNGVKLLTEGNPGDALQEFQKALSNATEGAKADCLYNIGVCYVRLGDMERATQAIVEAVKIDPALKEEISKDQDFAGLVDEPSFREFLQAAERQAESELRTKGDLLRQQLSALEPACRTQRKKVWTLVGVFGGCSLLFVAGAAAGIELFYGLAMISFVAGVFALQRVTLHSPFDDAQKLRRELETLAWQLSAPGHPNQKLRPTLTPDEQREVIRAFTRSGLAVGFMICAIVSLVSLAGGLATIWSPNTEPQLPLIFTALAAAFAAVARIIFVKARSILHKRLGEHPTASRTLRALLIGRP